jgi:iron complex outermembrane receptor protein
MAIRNNILSNGRLFAVVGALAALPGLPAMAAEPSQSSPALEEVVITARKRAESALNVPMSVSALAGDQLERRGVRNNRDLGAYFPGVSFNDSNGSNSEFSIRGLTSAGSGSDTSVGLYIDEVFLGDESSMSQRQFDLESFQILRGPQGTLFGRNTVAGAINIVTRKPEPEFGGALDASFGNFGLRQYGVTLNVPLMSDKLMARVSFVDRSRDGYLRNLAAPGVRGNDENGRSVRAHLLARPNDSLELLLSVDDSRDDTCDNMFRLVGGQLYTGNTNPDESAWDGPCNSERRMRGVSLRADQSFATSTLTAISAYRKRDTEFITDRDFTSRPILATGLDTDEQQFTQEIRLSGGSGDDLKWVVGAFYFERSYLQDTILELGPGFLGPGRTNRVNAIADLSTRSLAGFGSIEYPITAKLTAEAGLRYTSESKDLDYVQTATLPIPGFGVVPPFSKKVDGGEWSPTVTLTYKPAEAHTLYMRLARGFKSGGFNAGPSSNPARIEFAPEYLNSYEVGYKGAPSGRVRIDTSLFYLDYKDIQQSAQSGAGFFISNAARARSYGAELQVSARATESIGLNASLGLVDAQYTSFEANSGKRLPRAPRVTAAINLEYDRAIGTVGTLSFIPEVVYRAENFVDAANTALFRQEAHEQVNLRAAFESTQGWTISAWGRNLTDERVTLGGFSVAPLLFAVTTSPPRTYGLDLRWSF